MNNVFNDFLMLANIQFVENVSFAGSVVCRGRFVGCVASAYINSKQAWSSSQ